MMMMRLYRLFVLITSPKLYHRLWAGYLALLGTAATTAFLALFGKTSPLFVADDFGAMIRVVLESLLFWLLFIRFAVGDDNYMKRRFPWILDMQEVPTTPERYREQARCCGDLWFLCFQTTLLFVQADAIGDSARFFLLMEIILLVNGAWLLLNFVRDRLLTIERKTGEMTLTLRYPEFHEIGNLWSANNFFCLFLLGMVKIAEWHGLPESLAFPICFAVCLMNSAIDFLLTGRRVYLLQIRSVV